MMEQFDKNRLYHGFYLNEWDGPSLFIDACNFCELSDECDRLADDLNNIEYLCVFLTDALKTLNIKLNILRHISKR